MMPHYVPTTPYHFQNERGKGFTLIELLVVISIVGLLSSIVLVSLNSARLKAREASRQATINQIILAFKSYQATNGSYPAAYNSVANGGMECLSDPDQCGTWGNNGVNGNYYSVAVGSVNDLLRPYIKTFVNDPAASSRASSDLWCAYFWYIDGSPNSNGATEDTGAALYAHRIFWSSESASANACAPGQSSWINTNPSPDCGTQRCYYNLDQ